MTNKTVRGKTIQCKVSAEEYKKVEKKADKIGLSVSSYSRMVCLMAEIDPTSIKPKQFINILKISRGINDNDIERNKIIQCRVSAEEYEEIGKKASNTGLDIINYFRIICLMSNLYLKYNHQ